MESTMPLKTKSLTVPEVMQARYAEITAMTDALCRDKLNEEYAQVCREMTATLARKRPSPLDTGQAKSWACAIAYTVGSVNFLFDKSQTQPCARMTCAHGWDFPRARAEINPAKSSRFSRSV